MMKKLLLGFVLFLFLSLTSVFGSFTDDNLLFIDFNNATESVAMFDWSGNGNNLTNNGGSYDASQLAYNFDGALDYASRTSIGIYNDANFTINMWFNASSLQNACVFDDYASSSNKNAICIEIDGDIQFYNIHSGTFDFVTGSYSANNWYLVTYVKSGSSFEAYVNGVSAGTDTYVNPTSPTTMYVARRGQDTNQNLDGFISHISVYTRSFNSNEVSNFYSLGKNYNPYKSTSNNFEINAQDIWDSSSIITFNATIDNTTYNTTNGTIITPLLTNETSLYNITVQAEDYFSKIYTNYNLSSNLVAELKQSEIDFSILEIITTNSLTGNITIDATTQTTEDKWYLSAGSYNITYSNTQYPSTTFQITVAALENATKIQIVPTSIINVTAVQGYTANVLSGFNISITGINITYSNSSNTDSSFLEIAVAKMYEYELEITKDNYITKSAYITANQSINNYQFELFFNNLLIVNFFDEETRQPVLDVNYTLTSTNYGEVGSTSTGVFNLSGLADDKYTLTYDAVNYTSRNHIFFIPFTNASVTNRSLYLLKDASATDFVLTVQNKLGQTVEGLTASLLRQYVVGSETTYEIVEMMSPSVALDGATRFTAVANFVPYLFRIQDENLNILFQGAGTTADNVETLYLIDSSIFIKVDTGASPFNLAEDYDNFQYTFTNSSNKFWFNYDDAAGSFTQYGITVYANGTDIYASTSSTVSSGIISVSYTPNNQTTYRAVAWAIDSNKGIKVPIESIVIERINNSGAILFEALGWFMLFLSLIVFTIGLASNLGVAILFDVLAIMAFGPLLLGLIEISLVTQSSLLLVGLFVMYLIRRSN